MSESAPRLLIDARAARHQGREATLQLQRSRLADRRSGAVTVVAARTGRVHRPNQPMRTSTLSNWEKDFRQSEMLRACDGQRRTLRTGVAEGADGLAGALGPRSRVRSAVEVTFTSATGRSASKRSATASSCGFARPRSALRRV